MTRRDPPAWLCAPDMLSVVIREWVAGLERKARGYRGREFGRG